MNLPPLEIVNSVNVGIDVRYQNDVRFGRLYGRQILTSNVGTHAERVKGVVTKTYKI